MTLLIRQEMRIPSTERTWFAFRTLAGWYRSARPSTAHAPTEVVNARSARANVVRRQRGRIMALECDRGTQG